MSVRACMCVLLEHVGVSDTALAFRDSTDRGAVNMVSLFNTHIHRKEGKDRPSQPSSPFLTPSAIRASSSPDCHQFHFYIKSVSLCDAAFSFIGSVFCFVLFFSIKLSVSVRNIFLSDGYVREPKGTLNIFVLNFLNKYDISI